MEPKVVKIEIGKILAVVIAIIIIALIANTLIKSDYFKGSLFERGEVSFQIEDGLNDTSINHWDENVGTALDGGDETANDSRSFTLIENRSKYDFTKK